jgi:hypothetical protein
MQVGKEVISCRCIGLWIGSKYFQLSVSHILQNLNFLWAHLCSKRCSNLTHQIHLSHAIRSLPKHSYKVRTKVREYDLESLILNQKCQKLKTHVVMIKISLLKITRKITFWSIFSSFCHYPQDVMFVSHYWWYYSSLQSVASCGNQSLWLSPHYYTLNCMFLVFFIVSHCFTSYIVFNFCCIILIWCYYYTSQQQDSKSVHISQHHSLLILSKPRNWTQWLLHPAPYFTLNVLFSCECVVFVFDVPLWCLPSLILLPNYLLSHRPLLLLLKPQPVISGRPSWGASACL